MRRQALLDLVAEHVLELAGLVVHLVPGQVEVVGEKALAQTMAAHEPQRFAAAFLGKEDMARRVALNEPFAGQPGDHLRDGRGRQTELVGHMAHGRAPRLLGQLEDRLEILFATLASHRHVRLPSLLA
jgi:hypothetical protein